MQDGNPNFHDCDRLVGHRLPARLNINICGNYDRDREIGLYYVSRSNVAIVLEHDAIIMYRSLSGAYRSTLATEPPKDAIVIVVY